MTDLAQKSENAFDVTVVIPAYHEEAVIGSVVWDVKERFPDFEILVVDDGSTDQTAQAASKAGAKVISHLYNRGNGAAVTGCIRSAQGRLIVLMDGDGQHDPAQTPDFLKHADKYEMGGGARNFKTQGAFHRSWANRIYSSFASYPADHKVEDLTSGFRLIHRKLALLTLEIMKKSLDFNMILKDTSAYNIQFHHGKPIFIDTLSFEIYEEGLPWVGYGQFCRHFVAPLALMSKTDIRLSSLLRNHIDGPPLDLASRLLPFKTKLSFSLLLHIHLHAKNQQKYANINKPQPARINVSKKRAQGNY